MTWNDLPRELKDILASTSTDPDILRALSKDESWIIILGVAINEQTPIDVLCELIINCRSNNSKCIPSNTIATCAIENMEKRQNQYGRKNSI